MSAEIQEPTTEKTQKLSRGELLKALTAAGGAVAASSLLPAKWARPEVGAGALPAHAQGTQMYECWLDEPLEEDIASDYMFATNPPLPGLQVVIDFIVMVNGSLILSNKNVVTGANGTYKDSYWIGCGSAGRTVTLQFRSPAQPPEFYCVIGPLTVQETQACAGG